MQVDALNPINHPGLQPVRVLQHNVTARFEETNPQFAALTKQLMEAINFQPGIGYFISEGALVDLDDDGHNHTPYIDEQHKIMVHETFLSYIWCMCYSLMVLYEEAVAKPSHNQVAQQMVQVPDQAAIDRAHELLAYGRSLIKMYTPWDMAALPNPQRYNSDDVWVERANGVFTYAMNFILCHEFAHAEKQHIDQLNGLRRTPEEVRQVRIAFEKEADQRAIELMLQGTTTATAASQYSGILVGLCSMLFFSSTTTSRVHPSTDDRINAFIETVNPEPASPLWGIATLAFRLWDGQFSKDLTWPKEVRDMKELYYLVKGQVQANP